MLFLYPFIIFLFILICLTCNYLNTLESMVKLICFCLAHYNSTSTISTASVREKFQWSNCVFLGRKEGCWLPVIFLVHLFICRPGHFLLDAEIFFCGWHMLKCSFLLRGRCFFVNNDLGDGIMRLCETKMVAHVLSS